MGRRELIDIAVHVHAWTKRAALVFEMEDAGKPGLVEVTLPEWLAQDEGLI